MRPAQRAQRQALAIGRHGAALDRCRDARGRAPVPAHHRLHRPRQARHRDRARPRPTDRPHPHRRGRYAHHHLTVTPGPPSRNSTTSGTSSVAALLLFVAVALALYARHWAHLASRARVGAPQNRRYTAPSAPWSAKAGACATRCPWHGHGDIDHVALAPTAIAFAIETKTRTYHPSHLATVRAQAAWLEHRRHRWCPHGALPVLCVTRGPEVEHIEDDVLVVSLGRLNSALRAAARTGNRPGFLSPSAHAS